MASTVSCTAEIKALETQLRTLKSKLETGMAPRLTTAPASPSAAPSAAAAAAPPAYTPPSKAETITTSDFRPIKTPVTVTVTAPHAPITDLYLPNAVGDEIIIYALHSSFANYASTQAPHVDVQKRWACGYNPRLGLGGYFNLSDVQLADRKDGYEPMEGPGDLRVARKRNARRTSRKPGLSVSEGDYVRVLRCDGKGKWVYALNQKTCMMGWCKGSALQRVVALQPERESRRPYLFWNWTWGRVTIIDLRMGKIPAWILAGVEGGK